MAARLRSLLVGLLAPLGIFLSSGQWVMGQHRVHLEVTLYKEVNRLNDAKARNIDLYRHIFHDDNYVKEIQDKYEGKLDVTERLILPSHRAFSRTKV